VKSAATAIEGSTLAAKFREKTWPGIERCIKLRSGLHGIHPAPP
jgi:hypothetical protein